MSAVPDSIWTAVESAIPAMSEAALRDYALEVSRPQPDMTVEDRIRLLQIVLAECVKRWQP